MRGDFPEPSRSIGQLKSRFPRSIFVLPITAVLFRKTRYLSLIYHGSTKQDKVGFREVRNGIPDRRICFQGRSLVRGTLVEETGQAIGVRVCLLIAQADDPVDGRRCNGKIRRGI